MVRPNWPDAGDSSTTYVAKTAAVITDLQTAADAAAASAYVGALRPVNRMLVTMGDSIADNVNFPGPNSKSWAARACMLTNGEMQWVRSFGVGGATSTDVVEDQLSEVIAMIPRPGFVAIMMGANDTDVIDTFKANYTAIIDALLAVGIIPICGAVPPNSNSGNQLKAHRYNTWLSRECGRRGLPFVNFMEALVDTATAGAYASGNDLDGVHPSVTGAGVMAARMATTMTAYLSGHNIIDPYLANCNLDAATMADVIAQPRNCLFLNDTGSNGSADYWAINNSGAAAATLSLTNPVASDVIGKWQKLTRGVGDGGNRSRLTYASGFLVPQLPGDIVSVGYRFKATLESGGGSISIGFPHDGGGGSPATDLYSGPNTWTTDIAATTLGREFVVREDAANQLYAFFDFDSGEGSFSVGQFTCRNLTDLGVV